MYLIILVSYSVSKERRTEFEPCNKFVSKRSTESDLPKHSQRAFLGECEFDPVFSMSKSKPLTALHPAGVTYTDLNVMFQWLPPVFSVPLPKERCIFYFPFIHTPIFKDYSHFQLSISEDFLLFLLLATPYFDLLQHSQWLWAHSHQFYMPAKKTEARRTPACFSPCCFTIKQLFS